MVKKRSVFDIDFEPDRQETGPAANPERVLETKSMGSSASTRRGPMASAISETAEASADRAGAAAAIRAENDALAHEHVRLKKLGLITDLIATSDVHTQKLTRDRAASVDPQLSELKDSIQAVGLSNPIRVEQTDAGYELIQGFRRLSAFRELAEETGDPRYTRIPAALVPRGEPLINLYRKMVDENMVRKDLSFGEMAQLALSYARDENVSTQDAVKTLYASALKQKRRYIQQFTSLLLSLEPSLRFAEAVPRALGLDLLKLIDGDLDRAQRVRSYLEDHPDRDAKTEVELLRRCLKLPDTTKTQSPKVLAKSVSKTSLRLRRQEGEAKVTAADGRVELRLDRDFSAVPKAQLQRGIEAMLKVLDEKNGSRR